MKQVKPISVTETRNDSLSPIMSPSRLRRRNWRSRTSSLHNAVESPMDTDTDENSSVGSNSRPHSPAMDVAAVQQDPSNPPENVAKALMQGRRGKGRKGRKGSKQFFDSGDYFNPSTRNSSSTNSPNDSPPTPAYFRPRGDMQTPLLKMSLGDAATNPQA
eukprot:GFYU01000755.1.p1 GENE.GFYU01000755.1~~GFYU01000755.1.p1  ORF type:complete len:160 (-),score=13.19 GFYU01000755.1:373-852(-)